MASSRPLLLLVLLSLAEAQLAVFDLRASGLRSGLLGTPDPYVTVFSGSTSLGKTSVRRNNRNPWWEEEFSSYAAQVNEVLRLEVHDSDIGFDDLLGTCQRQIREGTHQHDCYLEEGGTLHYSYILYT
ncbi:perforin-1-like [Pseudoliparis swirei]|uniref:perforin-1-like n=1 Tax=Pseudoliparis swirei TaxID=2059687 RepID=UPI0024BD838C|nr:perforin-1-like [Pseudoliparis swirei]